MRNRINSKDRLKIKYEFYKGNKQILVFIHGLTGSLRSWDFVVLQLRKKGFSTLTFDIRGHGLSDKASEYSYSIDAIVEDLKLILKKKKLYKVVLIGHCFGAIVALQFAVKYPSSIRKIILISPEFNITSSWNRRLIKKIVYYLFFTLSKVLIFNSFQEKKYLNYSQFVGISDLNLWKIYRDISVTSFQTFLPFYDKIIQLDIMEWLKSLNVPVLIIYGIKDPFVTLNEAKRIHKLINRSKLELIDSNHCPILNHPDNISSLIENFLMHSKPLKTQCQLIER